MSVSYKDYYKALGVSRDASGDEIKKAFRNLARKYHPDKVQGDGKEAAEKKFKEINEAYEVLKNPDKRKRYDALGENWEAQDWSTGSADQNRYYGHGGANDDYEFHFEGTGFSDFFEQMFGTRRWSEQTNFGDSKRHSTHGNDIEAEIMVSLEEVAKGSKRRVTFSLLNSRTGKQEKRDFNLRIPIGVREGQRLRVAGLGEAGFGSGSSGDLYLRVRYARHPDFRVKGKDLYFDLPLAPWEAVLGGQFEAPTLKGRVRVKIHRGSTTKRKLRLKGKGLPDGKGNSGDLYIQPDVELPHQISAEEEKLWSQLSQISNFNPRK